MLKKILIFSMMLWAIPLSASPVLWKPVSDGLEEVQYSHLDSHNVAQDFLLYKIDLNKNKLKLLLDKDYSSKGISVRNLVERSGVLLAINAGFFDSDRKPLGLLVRDGKKINPLRNVAWWGVFSIDKNSIARIDALKDFQMSSHIQTAIQVGPRLVANGRVVSGLKSNVSQKTFVAQTGDSEIILGVTQKGQLDSVDLAKILVSRLKVKDALCFDGGSSTQLYSKINGVVKEVFGWSPIVSAVGIVKKS